jgi:hypothetical protein
MASPPQACAILNDHQGVLHLGDTDDLGPLFGPQADVGQFAFLRAVPGPIGPIGIQLGSGSQMECDVIMINIYMILFS